MKRDDRLKVSLETDGEGSPTIGEAMRELLKSELVSSKLIGFLLSHCQIPLALFCSSSIKTTFIGDGRCSTTSLEPLCLAPQVKMCAKERIGCSRQNSLTTHTLSSSIMAVIIDAAVKYSLSTAVRTRVCETRLHRRPSIPLSP